VQCSRDISTFLNKVFEPLLGLFLRVFINNFKVYNDKASHLTKLELVFQHLDGSRMILNLEKTTIGFFRKENGWTHYVKESSSHRSQKA